MVDFSEEVVLPELREAMVEARRIRGDEYPIPTIEQQRTLLDRIKSLGLPHPQAALVSALASDIKEGYIESIMKERLAEGVKDTGLGRS